MENNGNIQDNQDISMQETNESNAEFEKLLYYDSDESKDLLAKVENKNNAENHPNNLQIVGENCCTPYPNAPDGWLEKVLSTGNNWFWKEIVEYLGFYEIREICCVNRDFHKRYKELMEISDFKIAFMQSYYEKLLVGRTIYENIEYPRHFEVKAIDLKTKCILVKRFDYFIICFSEDFVTPPKFTGDSKGITKNLNISRICGYRMNDHKISLGEDHKRLCCDAWIMERIRNQNEITIDLPLREIREKSKKTYDEISKDPEFKERNNFTFEVVDLLRKLKTQRYIPKSCFSYQLRVKLGEQNDYPVPVLHFGLDTIFDLEDKKAPVLLRQMVELDREIEKIANLLYFYPVSTDVRPILKRVKEIRDFMDDRMTFEKMITLPGMGLILCEYFGSDVEFFGESFFLLIYSFLAKISRLNKQCYKIAHSVVEVNWKKFAYPLYQNTLIGGIISNKLIIKNIDFENKVIFCRNIDSDFDYISEAISFSDHHHRYDIYGDKIRLSCGFCGAEFTDMMIKVWEVCGSDWKNCRLQSSYQEQTSHREEMKDFYRDSLDEAKNVAQKRLDSIRIRGYPSNTSIKYEAKVEWEELFAIKEIKYMDRIPNGEYVYGINLDMRYRGYTEELTENDIFAVSLDRLFIENDFNALRLIVLMKRVKSKLHNIGWKAGLAPLNRLRSVLKEVNPEIVMQPEKNLKEDNPKPKKTKRTRKYKEPTRRSERIKEREESKKKRLKRQKLCFFI